MKGKCADFIDEYFKVVEILLNMNGKLKSLFPSIWFVDFLLIHFFDSIHKPWTPCPILMYCGGGVLSFLSILLCHFLYLC